TFVFIHQTCFPNFFYPMKTLSFLVTILLPAVMSTSLYGQSRSNHGNKFEQLETLLPSPNNYRNMDGSPGPDYWQQRVDYEIECALDEKERKLSGTEKITYYNQSPSTLQYLWLQLDENEH